MFVTYVANIFTHFLLISEFVHSAFCHFFCSLEKISQFGDLRLIPGSPIIFDLRCLQSPVHSTTPSGLPMVNASGRLSEVIGAP